MSGMDIVHLYGDFYAVQDVADAWRTAGSPPINDAGRLYAQQKRAWDAYRNGTGSPADDPDRPAIFPLAHVRFAALDIDPTPDRVRALTAAGLVRPYSYEPWHWQAPGDIRYYPLVYSIPATAGGDAAPLPTPPALPIPGGKTMLIIHNTSNPTQLVLVTADAGQIRARYLEDKFERAVFVGASPALPVTPCDDETFAGFLARVDYIYGAPIPLIEVKASDR